MRSKLVRNQHGSRHGVVSQQSASTYDQGQHNDCEPTTNSLNDSKDDDAMVAAMAGDDVEASNAAGVAPTATAQVDRFDMPRIIVKLLSLTT